LFSDYYIDFYKIRAPSVIPEKGFYALGNTGNSLPVPEGQEKMQNTYNFSRLLVLHTQTATSC